MSTLARKRAPSASVGTDTRTLLVTIGSGRKYSDVEAGQFKITIPKSAKVTFSGTNPQHPTMGAATLRIYETEKVQLAVFTNVVEFRDLSLGLERIVVERDETVYEDGNGYTRHTSSKKKYAVIESH